MDCLDNPKARYLAAQTCQHLDTPIVYGAVAGWLGHGRTVCPGDASFTTVYGEPFHTGRFDANQHGTSQHQTRGNLPFTTYPITTIQAAKTVKAMLDRPSQIRNLLLMIDLLSGSVDEVELCRIAKPSHYPNAFQYPSAKKLAKTLHFRSNSESPPQKKGMASFDESKLAFG